MGGKQQEEKSLTMLNSRTREKITVKLGEFSPSDISAWYSKYENIRSEMDLCEVFSSLRISILPAGSQHHLPSPWGRKMSKLQNLKPVGNLGEQKQEYEDSQLLRPQQISHCWELPAGLGRSWLLREVFPSYKIKRERRLIKHRAQDWFCPGTPSQHHHHHWA